MVSIPDSDPDPLANAIDLAFSDGAGEVLSIRHADGNVLMLARVNVGEDFFVYRGSSEHGGWTQLGKPITNTPIGMWIDGSKAYVLANRSDVVGLGCQEISLSAGTDTAWEACPGFPDYTSKTGDGPFAVRGDFVGDAQAVAAWFEVKNLSEPTIAVHQLNAGVWVDMGAQALPQPASWAMDGDRVILGFTGTGQESLLFATNTDGSIEPMSQKGLPAPASNSAGIVGICALDGGNYVLEQEPDAGFMKLDVYRSGEVAVRR